MTIGVATEASAERWFLGEFEFAIDSQRRVAIPKAWRGDGECSRFFLLPGRDRSLQLVPAESFQELLQKLRKVSFADARASTALATIGSMAQECLCDKQGRVSLTPKLMQHAHLKEKVLMIGAVTSVQIWSPEIWQAKQMDSDACLDVIQAIQERPDDFTDILRNAVTR